MSKSTKAAVTEVNTAVEVAPLANINGVHAYETTSLKWLATANPKRPSGKAHARFERYMQATTVGEYISSGGTKADLRYDVAKGYVALV